MSSRGQDTSFYFSVTELSFSLDLSVCLPDYGRRSLANPSSTQLSHLHGFGEAEALVAAGVKSQRACYWPATTWQLAFARALVYDK